MSINYLFIYLFYPRFEQPGPDFLSFFFFFSLVQFGDQKEVSLQSNEG